MHWKKNWPLLAGAVAVLLLVYFGTATFSWLSAGQKVENSFLAGSPGVQLTEAFTPPENWKAGEEIVKRVGVVNVGTAGMLVRISFDEILRLIDADPDTYYKMKATPDISGDEIPVPFNVDDFPGYTQISSGDILSGSLPPKLVILHKKLTNGTGPYARTAYVYAAYFEYGAAGSEKRQLVALQNDRSNGKFAISAAPGTPQKFTVNLGMIKYCYFPGVTETKKNWAQSPFPSGRSISMLDGKILLKYDITSVVDALPSTPSNKWYFNAADGYFYYMQELKPGSASSTQLASVTLASDADPLKYNLAKYTLNINMDAIQCDKAALRSTWFTSMSEAQLTESTLYQRLLSLCPAP